MCGRIKFWELGIGACASLLDLKQTRGHEHGHPHLSFPPFQTPPISFFYTFVITPYMPQYSAMSKCVVFFCVGHSQADLKCYRSSVIFCASLGCISPRMFSHTPCRSLKYWPILGHVPVISSGLMLLSPPSSPTVDALPANRGHEPQSHCMLPWQLGLWLQSYRHQPHHGGWSLFKCLNIDNILIICKVHHACKQL
jgi:hypothetical protein